MLPFFRVNENYSIGLGCEIMYECLECGHNALSLRVTVLSWTIDTGIEFK